MGRLRQLQRFGLVRAALILWGAWAVLSTLSFAFFGRGLVPNADGMTHSRSMVVGLVHIVGVIALLFAMPSSWWKGSAR